MSAANEANDLIHIVAIIRELSNARRYLGDMTLDEFEADDEKQHSVSMAVSICGEQVKGLSQEFREREPSIEWRRIAGMRDWIVHDYDGLDFRTLYHAVTVDAPQVLAVLRPYAEMAAGVRPNAADPFDVPRVE